MSRRSTVPSGQVGMSPSARPADPPSMAREAEAAVRRLALLTEHSSDVLCEMRQGIVTYASPNTMRVSGRGPEEFVGQPFSQIIHPDDMARLAHFMAPGWTGAI